MMMQAGLDGHEGLDACRASCGGKLAKYDNSVAPRICTRSACTWRTKPASASPGFCTRLTAMPPAQPGLPASSTV